MKEWFSKGWDETIKEKTKLEALSQMKRDRATPRFYLKEGEEAEIMFVDDSPFNVYEHKVELNGKWETLICTKEWQVCPICRAFPKNKSSFTVYLTIIDFRPYTKSDGKVIKLQKKLYGAKFNMPKVLYDLNKRLKGLSSVLCKVKRYDAKSPSSGDYIEAIKRVKDPLKLVGSKEDLTPYDYEKVFAPFTDDELKALGITGVSILGEDTEEDFKSIPEDIADVFKE